MDNTLGGAPIQLGAVVRMAEADAFLARLKGKAADLRPVFAGVIDPSVTRALRDQFETSGRALGTPWQALSLVTRRLRSRPDPRRGGRASTSKVGRAKFGFAAILRDTGRLAQSLVSPGDPEGIRDIGVQRYARGSSVPYAALHQEGFTVTQMFGRPLRSPKRVAPRPIIPENLPAPLIASWEGAVVQYLTSGTL
jgi:hypothetical protein